MQITGQMIITNCGFKRTDYLDPVEVKQIYLDSEQADIHRLIIVNLIHRCTYIEKC